MNDLFYTYVLYSIKYNKIYIGYSSNYKKRLQSHNDFRNSGWTKKFQPWILIYLQTFDVKASALKREKELKSGRGRNFIWDYINRKRGNNEELSWFSPSTDG